jgi:hypothetical protein
MTTTTYKGYTIRNVGTSWYIYRPGRVPVPPSDGHEQSLAAAKRWINTDLAKQNESAYRA